MSDMTPNPKQHSQEADPMPDPQVMDGPGPHRRDSDAIAWSEVENRLRILLGEFRLDMLAEIYTRNFDPLKERVDRQDAYCALHSQQLTQTTTLLNELVEAKMIRRLEVAESRISMMGKFQAAIGMAALTSIIGLLMLVVTHQIHL